MECGLCYYKDRESEQSKQGEEERDNKWTLKSYWDQLAGCLTVDKDFYYINSLVHHK